MQTDNGRLHFIADIDNTALQRDAARSRQILQGIGAGGAQAGQQVQQAFGAMSGAATQSILNIKSAISGMAQQMLGFSAIIGAGSFIKSLYDQGLEFAKQMRIVSTISEDVAGNMDGFKQQVLGICKEIAVAPQEAAAALYQINSAGHLGADGLHILEVAAKAAIGGVTTTATAADTITTILNAYSMKAEDAESISDKLFTTVRLGKTTMTELGSSISYVAPIAATYKISIDEVLTAVAALTKQGTSTQNAMTQISAAITAVANEFGDDAFKEGFLPALENVEKAADGSNAALKAQLSNIRAVRGALALTGDHAAEVKMMYDQLQNCAGAAEAAYKKMNASMSAEMTKLRTNFLAAFEEIGSGMSGITGDIAKFLNSAFDSGSMQKCLVALKEIIIAYGVYKGLLFAVAAYHKVAAGMAYKAELAELSKALPLKKASANADIEAAVAAGRLSQAKAEQVVAIRAEVAAVREEAVAKKNAALATELSARKQYQTALRAHVLAKQRVAVAQQEVAAAVKSGTATDIETAKKNAATAATEVNTTAIAKNTAHKNLAAATTARKNAVTEADIAITNADTAAQRANAASATIQASAVSGLRGAFSKLNAVISANPYIFAATALFALYQAVETLRTETYVAAKAQKQLSEAMNTAQGDIDKERKKTEVLVKTLRRAAEGSDAYNKARQALIDQAQTYGITLTDEDLKVANLTDTYNKLTEAVHNSITARQLNTLYDTYFDADYLKKIADSVDSFKKKMEKKYGDDNPKAEQLTEAYRRYVSTGAQSPALQREFDEELAVFKTLDKGYQTINGAVDAVDEFNGTLGTVAKGFLSMVGYAPVLAMGGNYLTFSEEAAALAKESKDKREKLRGFANVENDDQLTRKMNGLPAKDETQKDKNAETDKTAELQKAIDELVKRSQEAKTAKDISASLDELEQTLKGKKQSVNLDVNSTGYKQIQSAFKALNNRAPEELKKDKGGDTSAKTAQQQIEARQKLNRETEELAHQNQEALTAMEKDGTAKRLAIIDNEFAERQKALRRQAEDWAKENKKAGTTATGRSVTLGETNVAGLTQEQAAALNQSYQIAKDKRIRDTNEVYRSQTEAMMQFLADYGTFEARKLAVTEQYEKRIQAASSEGERLSLAKQRDKAVSGIETEAIKQQIDWSGVFSGVGNLLDEQIRPVLQNLREYTQTEAFKNAPVKDQETVLGYIDQLEQKIGGGLKQSFAEAGKALDDYRAAMLAKEQADKKAAEALKAYETARKTATSLGADGKPVVNENDTALVAAREKLVAATNEQAEAGNKASNALNKVQTTSTHVAGALDKILGGIQWLQSGSLAGIFDGISKLVAAFGGSKDLAGDLAKKMSEKIGGTIGKAFETFGAGLISLILQILDILKDGIENLFSSLIDTVLGAVNGILKSLLSGKIFTSIGKSLYQGVSGILNTITFGGLSSLFSSSNAKEVKETTDRLTKRNEVLGKSIDNLTDQIKSTGGALAISSAKKAIDQKQEYIENQRQLLATQMGYHGAHHSNTHNINKALEDADWSQIEAVLGKKMTHAASALWQLSPEDLKKLQTIPEVWDKIVNSGKYDKSEYLNAYIEQAEGVKEITDKLKQALTQTSFDSLRDSFLSTVLDMTSTADDFASSFEKMLQKSILNARLSDLYDSQIQELYDKWAEYSEQTNGQLTEAMVADLNARQQAITEGMLAERQRMADTFGWDTQGTRQGASKGIAQASQDSIDELNGRATAIQSHTFSIAENTKLMLAVTNDILRSVTAIEHNTDRLQNMESSLKSVKDTVSDLSLKGIKIR